MKMFRKATSSQFIVLPLISAILLMSCKDSIEIKRSYTGEEIYKGIMFGTGEVANLIPTINEMNKFRSTLNMSILNEEKTHQLDQVYALIMEHISNTDPHFFSNFGLKIRSGNHILIQNTLLEGVAKMKTAVTEMSGFSEEQLINISAKLNTKGMYDETGKLSANKIKAMIKEFANSSAQSGQKMSEACMAFVLVVLVAAAYTIIIAVNIAGIVEYAVAAVDVEVIVREAERANNPNNFDGEKMINEIAENLR